MKSLALLLLRLTTGGLLIGHGGQKLFGWFSGPGLEGTSGWMESMGLKPGRPWAILAGGSEFVGGVLLSLGLFTPLGALSALSAMGMATTKVHWGKPIWVTEGGAELPLTNGAVATALILTGPGKISMDEAFGTKLPGWVVVPGLALAATGVATGLWVSNHPEQAQQITQTVTSAAQQVTQQMKQAVGASGEAGQTGQIGAATLESDQTITGQTQQPAPSM